MVKPVIGITCNLMADIPNAVSAGIAAHGQSWLLLADDYVHAIRKAGGSPLILPTDAEGDDSPSVIEKLDGILISGGNDVSPRFYGERFDKHCGMLDTKRDQFELRLARLALEKDIPLLGICRGLQVFNVAQGGTLYQDLPSQIDFEEHSIWCGERNAATHTVTILSDTPLADILGEETVWVNSFHHQGVRDLAPGLKPAARSQDGVVEAFWLPGKRFALAVQWHPEMMFDSPLQARIFTAFIDACRG